MKRLMSMLIVCFIACGLLVSKAQGKQNQSKQTVEADTTATDTTLDVIAYFAKGDTCDYWISETKWKINGKDTIKTTDIATKIRLVVTDSTATGYKMNYTFMDIDNDTTTNSLEAKLANAIAERVGKTVIGTTIEFETDEYGTITKIHNLSQIKKQAKTLFKDCMKDLANMPEMKFMKELGFDISDISKNVSTDELVEGYVEELKDLFFCHGNTYKIGETEEHEDATENSYESDSNRSVSIDEDGNYTIQGEVISVIPQSDIKALLSGFVGALKDKSISENFDKEFDSQVNVDAKNSSWFAISCYPDGWPYEVIKQNKVKLGDLEKVSQTHIEECYFSHIKK